MKSTIFCLTFLLFKYAPPCSIKRLASELDGHKPVVSNNLNTGTPLINFSFSIKVVGVESSSVIAEHPVDRPPGTETKSLLDHRLTDVKPHNDIDVAHRETLNVDGDKI